MGSMQMSRVTRATADRGRAKEDAEREKEIATGLYHVGLERFCDVRSAFALQSTQLVVLREEITFIL